MPRGPDEPETLADKALYDADNCGKGALGQGPAISALSVFSSGRDPGETPLEEVHDDDETDHAEVHHGDGDSGVPQPLDHQERHDRMIRDTIVTCRTPVTRRSAGC